ncbi:MAG: formylglycine-generating enzyme family protein [Treponema sp.]|jgi:formylglycine-generating enzyme required for sulfatase activity|nr:formylglycine-generating enzyme family protein [Treponema sp.]
MKKIAILIIMICFIISGLASQENTMIRINGGTFTMGSPANEPGRESNETQRQVTVSSFYMSRYPVTQKEYQEIMGTNPSYFRGDNLPVEMVRWWDALEYCNRRSHREGLTLAYLIDRERGIVTWNRDATGYRLPTEAEWEYACRAGTITAYNTGNNITSSQANFDGIREWQEEVVNEFGVVNRITRSEGEYRQETTPVGSFAPNAWGLYDMHGNVWEWCWDLYGSYATGAQTNPTGAVSSDGRVLRGGGWDDDGQYLRSAYRDVNYPSSRSYFIGFRLVRP